MSPIILVGAGILLFGLGLGLGYLLSHSLRKREAAKACDIQNELDDLKRTSANAVRVSNERNELRSRVATLTRETEDLKQENRNSPCEKTDLSDSCCPQTKLFR